MNRRKLLWRIYPYYVAIILLSLAAAALYASREIHRVYQTEAAQMLETQARVLLEQIGPSLYAGNPALVDSLCKRLGGLSRTRVTVVDLSGVVVGDSDEDPAQMENHGSRPEIIQALRESVGTSARFSNTLQINLLYVAIPAVSNGQLLGTVRTSQPLTAIESSVNRLLIRISMAGVAILIVATIISYFLFRSVSVRLDHLRLGAEQMAAGNLQTRLSLPDTLEVAAVADSMNKMAEQLESRLRTITEQRNEREAILASMFEGVIAVDLDDRIVTMNRAARSMFSLTEGSIGQDIVGVVRTPALQELIAAASDSDDPVTGDLLLPGDPERHLQVHLTALLDGAGNRVGLVVVLNDLTGVRQLERVRRDFVANVSHELKTPITAIKGAAETLLDQEHPPPTDVRRFLNIILKNTGRLIALVDDLLELARLESADEQGGPDLRPTELKPILEASIDSLRVLAKENGMTITCTCSADLRANVYADGLFQAVGNLIDNAIKHSGSATEIAVSALTIEDETVIMVEDNGIGIDRKHIPRLFERFYRADSSRSASTGGTGLGLSLVKHITQAHGGHISVDSQPGAGAIFRIHLPGSRS